jgi:nicotinate-nucleotide pyrophosphorylase (carboxylating)
VHGAKEKLGYLHKVAVEVTNESEVKEAIGAGAEVLMFAAITAEELKRLAAVARSLSESVMIECCGAMTPANVREYAEAGARLIRVEALTNAAPAMKISFNVQPY